MAGLTAQMVASRVRNIKTLSKLMPTLGSQLSRLSSTVTSDDLKPRPFSEVPRMSPLQILSLIMKSLFSRTYASEMHLFWDHLLEKYGPVTSLPVPGESKLVVIWRPEDVETLFRATMDDPIRDGFQSLKKIRYESLGNYFQGKGGLLTENHEEWWRVRSRVQTPMMRPKNLVRYLPQLDEVTLTFMDRIADFQKALGEMPENFLEEMYKWALECVALVAVNKRLGCLDKNLSPNSNQILLINTVNNMFECLSHTEMRLKWWKIVETPPFKKLREAHELFLRIVESHILEAEEELRRKVSGKTDSDQEMTLLETLLQQDGIKRIDVITLILDMFFAGIDTTSHSLGFTLYLLAKNPAAQRRLQEELDSVLGDGRDTITEAHLARMSFLKACVKESMRLFPIAPGSARVLTKDSVIGGYIIPKGYNVFAALIYTTKNESVFPRAKEFIPERWGRDKPLGPIHPYASLPFSHGTRMCIGRRIAEQEIYIFLARVMHRFNVSYKYKDMNIVTRLVSLPSEPLKFEFTERRTS